MPWSSKGSTSSAPACESAAAVFDDGGSGLLEACRSRFESSGCEISCDARHTVWIKRADGSLSVGLSPWQPSRHSTEEILAGVAARLRR